LGTGYEKEVIMIDYVKYRCKIATLYEQRECLSARCAADIKSAHREGKTRQDIENLRSDYRHEIDELNEDIASLLTAYIISKANRKFVPIPPLQETGMWEQSTITQRYVLTASGISKVRSSLRADRKEQIELFLPIVAALTGVIGVATAFVALLLKFK
jgi:hypothetical protein